MKNFLLIFLFSLTITIWSSAFCAAQSDSVKTNSTAKQTQTAQNSPADHCYLCYLKEKPFAHWETWVIMLIISVISGLFSAPEWAKEGYGDITEGCFLFIIAGIGFILAAVLAACTYESFLIFVAFCMSCLFGIVVLGQIIARHRDGR